jgi:hypothetical protein
MIGWESQDGTERLIAYQCINTGQVSITRRKGSDNANLPVEFQLEAPVDRSALQVHHRGRRPPGCVTDALIGEFEAAVKEADPNREPDTFKLQGQTFTVADEPNIIALGRFARAAARVRTVTTWRAWRR